MEGESWRGIMEEESWRRNPSCGILAVGCLFVIHLAYLCYTIYTV